jgi:hypothetical protein
MILARQSATMSTPPKRDPREAFAAPIPAPEPADYSDELTEAQLRALRQLAPQDEADMGDLVHEFRW